MVTVEVKGPQATIIGALPPKFQRDLYLATSFEHARMIWRPETLPAWDDGRIGVYYPRSGRIPTGCIPRLEHALRQWGIDYEVSRVLPPPNKEYLHFPARSFDRRPYQVRMLKAALNTPYATLHAPARSGKTFVAAAYIACRQQAPSMFLVNTIDLCLQARDELGSWLGEPVGLIGDGIYEPKDVTVGSIQSLHPALVKCGKAKRVNPKYDPTYQEERPLPHHKEAVRLLEATTLRVIDEMHFSRAPTHQAVHKAMKNCAYSLGLSATPWSEGNDAILLEASCGPVVLSISYSDLIDEGQLVEPLIEIQHMPSHRFPGNSHYQTIYKDYIVENDLRNNAIVDFCQRMEDEHHITMVFVDQIKHGKHLADLTGGKFVHGGITGTKRKQIWNAMRRRQLPLAISTVGKYGLDIPALDACVIACGGKSAIQALQTMPRVLTATAGKDHAHVLDFWDHARYLSNHSKRRISLYESERRFKLTFVDANNASLPVEGLSAKATDVPATSFVGCTVSTTAWTKCRETTIQATGHATTKH